jgi:enoyl-CoA hydratase/carnithine racemase
MTDVLPRVPGCEPPVKSDHRGPVVRVTLNNPPANALSIAVMERLQAELDRIARDESARLVVLRSAGKMFSAGHDLKELSSHQTDEDRGRNFFARTFALCARLMQSIINFPKPVIAEIDGVATAAGCQLVASCDLAIASERSRFGVNGINVGLFCTTPAVALTRVIGRRRAMEMLLTGKMIDARTAEEFGLVNRVVQHDNLAHTVDELANEIARKAPIAIKIGKDGVEKQSGLCLSEAYDLASQIMVENMLEAEAQEGISAFLEHREPRWNQSRHPDG